MSEGLELGRFSVGVGDRFAHQARAQLRACVEAYEAGVEVVPVWNKSNREHMLIGSEPGQTRAAADAAVSALRWSKPVFCGRGPHQPEDGGAVCEAVRFLHD